MCELVTVLIKLRTKSEEGVGWSEKIIIIIIVIMMVSGFSF